jgi:hypothetical protein
MRRVENRAMSWNRRRAARRVAGIGVAAALVVLGLQVPAFATLGISGFTPDNGPANCVVMITGTDFVNPDVTGVEFGATAATDFTIVSDTEIWAAAPAASGFITLTKASTAETVSSSAQFTSTTGAGNCAPTITSFSRTCGMVGTIVTITGSNLIRYTTDFVGGLVEFSPFTDTGGADGVDATHTGAPEDPTSLSVVVPTGAATGPISVTTAGGEVFSTADFEVVTNDDVCLRPPIDHIRSITLRLKRHLVAKGRVSLSDPTDTFTQCIAGVTVRIQRRTSDGWTKIASTTTSDTGTYRKRIKDRPGKYRAKAATIRIETADLHICWAAVSRVRRR